MKSDRRRPTAGRKEVISGLPSVVSDQCLPIEIIEEHNQ
jgi:hypothetical protein